MQLENIPVLIAGELSIKPSQAASVISLIADGNTIPFIARYRKEATGELDEEKIRLITERSQYLENLIKRQEEVISSIDNQGKLTKELAEAIYATTKLQDLEDLYLPYRPKKRTRAQVAREKGLEPLALTMLEQQLKDGDPLETAANYLNPEAGIDTPELALAGAMDIVAEIISEQADIRAILRKLIWQNAQISTELAANSKKDNQDSKKENKNSRQTSENTAKDHSTGKEFLNYQEYSEPVKRIPSHRILAVNRGEEKGALKVSLLTDHESNAGQIIRKVVKAPSIFQQTLEEAITDGYKRLLFPSIEREIRALLTENAEKQAIRVFGLNLRQLLLQSPLAGHIVMGLDPGYRTGCKMAIVDATGAVLAIDTLYFTMSQNRAQEAAAKMLEHLKKHEVTLISIGNGTASYETEEFTAKLINEHNLKVRYIIANEAGASVYSASKLAKEELPTLDVSIRGAVSIARRVQDPLSELVKIDPKSIGVGQYQHDVNQKELGTTLFSVVESCVNHVGVELNTASPALLTYVAGISSSVAKNIVAHRNEHGIFKDRKHLLKVARLGPAAFTQCAGFLRIAAANNALDNTSVHPESYSLAETILSQLGFSLAELGDKNKLSQIQSKALETDAGLLAEQLGAGEPTVRDILNALAKPGRDPREDVPPPQTRKNIVKLSDLAAGSVVKGTIHNITDFGVFVDIGIKVNGLIHRSELSNKPFLHPIDLVSVGDIVTVVILHIDEERGRIALSLKQVPETE